MSFEGFYQCICETGHYFELDAYESLAGFCVKCGEPIKYWRLVDETNGTDLQDLRTVRLGIDETISYDVPMEDHRGNKYVVKDQRYRPSFDTLEWWHEVGE